MSSTFPRLSSTIASSIRSKSFSTTKVLQRSLATHASINPTTSTYSTSSSSSTSTWSPPIEPSSEPAYESALEFLKAYSHKTLSQVEELQRQLKKDQSNLSDQQKLELKNRIHKLSIAAEINDPKRRWEFAQGKGQYSLKSLKCKGSLRENLGEVVRRKRRRASLRALSPIHCCSGHPVSEPRATQDCMGLIDFGLGKDE